MTTRQIIRYHASAGHLQWLVERFEGPEWVYRSRDEAIRIQKQFASCPQDWFKPLADEYARQIEAAIAEYDMQSPERLEQPCQATQGLSVSTSRDGPMPGDRPSTEYDAQENEDEELRYITETAA